MFQSSYFFPEKIFLEATKLQDWLAFYLSFFILCLLLKSLGIHKENSIEDVSQTLIKRINNFQYIYFL